MFCFSSVKAEEIFRVRSRTEIRDNMCVCLDYNQLVSDFIRYD